MFQQFRDDVMSQYNYLSSSVFLSGFYLENNNAIKFDIIKNLHDFFKTKALRSGSDLFKSLDRTAVHIMDLIISQAYQNYEDKKHELIEYETSGVLEFLHQYVNEAWSDYASTALGALLWRKFHEDREYYEDTSLFLNKINPNRFRPMYDVFCAKYSSANPQKPDHLLDQYFVGSSTFDDDIETVVGDKDNQENEVPVVNELDISCRDDIRLSSSSHPVPR
jgi:hypothetical protein